MAVAAGEAEGRDGVCDSAKDPVSAPESFYVAAKRAEVVDQDYDRALELYQQAVLIGDRRESAVKDTAGLLHALGRSQEALNFLLAHESCMGDRRKYRNLLANLVRLWGSDAAASDTPDYMRTLKVQINRAVEPAARLDEPEFCMRLFRNNARIRRIVVCGRDGLQGFVEFASHSAARKALVHWEGRGATWTSLVGMSWAPPEAKTSLFDEAVPEPQDSTLPTPSTPPVHHLPDGCWSVADLAVFHLLPRSLWQELVDAVVQQDSSRTVAARISLASALSAGGA